MNIITREFEGHAVHTFVWNGKLCWIASEIVALFGYADPSTTIRQCISVEDFDEGQEYDVLTKSYLKAFKRMVRSLTNLKLVSEKTPHLIIFYEDGLYGFLQYTEKPVGVRFRKWVRREVVPAIRQSGTYSLTGTEPVPIETPRAPRRKTKEAPLPLSSVNNAARILMKAMAGTSLDPDTRLRMVTELYTRAGIRFPDEPKALLPVPVSRNAAILTSEFEGLKAAYQGVSEEAIQDDILEILASDNRPSAKYVVVKMLESIKTGKANSIN